MKYILKTALFSLLIITAFMTTSQRAAAEAYIVCAGSSFGVDPSNVPQALCPGACQNASTSNMEYRWDPNNWRMIWGAKDSKGNVCPGNSICGCVF